MTPARLFVVGGVEQRSREGMTMAIYALAITPLLNIMIATIGDEHNKMAAFADDVSASGKLLALRNLWNQLILLVT